jgi:hypothetical protein
MCQRPPCLRPSLPLLALPTSSARVPAAGKKRAWPAQHTAGFGSRAMPTRMRCCAHTQHMFQVASPTCCCCHPPATTPGTGARRCLPLAPAAAALLWPACGAAPAHLAPGRGVRCLVLPYARQPRGRARPVLAVRVAKEVAQQLLLVRYPQREEALHLRAGGRAGGRRPWPAWQLLCGAGRASWRWVRCRARPCPGRAPRARAGSAQGAGAPGGASAGWTAGSCCRNRSGSARRDPPPARRERC